VVAAILRMTSPYYGCNLLKDWEDAEGSSVAALIRWLKLHAYYRHLIVKQQGA